MPKSKEQFEAIRANRKQQILDVALDTFANEGFHSASVSMIAKKANISKGLMYNYFKSKEDLLKEILHEGIQILKELMGEKEINTDQDLIDVIDRSIESVRVNKNFWRFYLSLIMQPRIYPLIQEKLMEELMPYMIKISKYFEKNSTNPQAEAFLFGATFDGLFMNYLINTSVIDLNEIRNLMIEKFIIKNQNRNLK